MLNGEPVYINGDGKTSRDFCFVDNAVQANLLAATTQYETVTSQIYNVAAGDHNINLNQLYKLLRVNLARHCVHLSNIEPIYQGFRTGDVRHSLADICKAKKQLGYHPSHCIHEELTRTVDWYWSQSVTKNVEI
jgi:UDP-N-acetylglucosamine 4-epimerase